jgi:hypothetical protein
MPTLGALGVEYSPMDVAAEMWYSISWTYRLVKEPLK